MKEFISKAQKFGKRAAELRQAVQNLPGQASKLREAVTMTGGELQQLRTDVESTIHALKTDNEERLLTTMREINDHAAVFTEAGYQLTGMDLDMAIHQRLAVHLEKFDNVSQSTLRSLQGRQNCESIKSVLAAIIKAEETAANVELTQLQHSGLIVHIGAIPMMRMLWRLEDTVVAEVPALSTTRGVIPATPQFGSMFEPRAMPTAVRDATSAHAAAIPAAAPDVDQEKASGASAWSLSALDRFKKMPGSSKYGR